MDLDNVNYVLKKTTFPSIQDRGILDVKVPDSKVILTQGVDAKSAKVEVLVPRPSLLFRESKHMILNKLFVKPMMEKKLKKAIEDVSWTFTIGRGAK